MKGDFRVGDWLVQHKVGTITKGDHEISLEPKVMEVLVYLARHGQGASSSTKDRKKVDGSSR